MTVYLLGAGPGDPGMVTLRAAALLARCDLVVHDRLVDSRVLALANPAALRVDVGKRPGSGEMTQEEINTLLVDKGRDGIVVRLKGGDPFVFGRGGEEALVLTEAGIDYEIVPGLSSALAVPAAAGVPVTLRGVASAVVILTGHDPDSIEGLDELARSGATLVVLMAGASRARLAARLLAVGMDPATPVVATQSGTLPQQKSVRCTLGELAEQSLESPVTIVIGRVAAEHLMAFEDRPLAGIRVVLTRQSEEVAPLAGLLAERGALPIVFPTIAIAPPSDGLAALHQEAGDLQRYEWVVFASVHAVEAFFSCVRDARELFGVAVAAVGGATAAALAAHGIVADLIPERAGAQGLLESFAPPGAAASVLLPRAAGGLEQIEVGLAALGYRVEVVEAYATVPPVVERGALDALTGCDAVLFASPSAVDNYLALAGREHLGELAVSIGPTTTARLEALGIPAVQARTATAEAMVDALVRWAQERFAPSS